ncbi:hypothetical protein ACJX0J_018440, partial [Zea mays]
ENDNYLRAKKVVLISIDDGETLDHVLHHRTLAHLNLSNVLGVFRDTNMSSLDTPKPIIPIFIIATLFELCFILSFLMFF